MINTTINTLGCCLSSFNRHHLLLDVLSICCCRLFHPRELFVEGLLRLLFLGSVVLLFFQHLDVGVDGIPFPLLIKDILRPDTTISVSLQERTEDPFLCCHERQVARISIVSVNSGGKVEGPGSAPEGSRSTQNLESR